MPELVEQMYCSQQIVIPPKFPYILKRYCKAAIKTQPYDLLRWSYEYFKALAERRPPPVKLRLEYPVYSTEGGLTRGCLKVLANQLTGQQSLPLDMVKGAWQGFCLDPDELLRIFCLCEVYLREESLPFLRFIAVAAGMLTKSLTHTMILLCETLTKEPDGGSAAIPVQDFLAMYRFLANKDASKDVKYINGYKEGEEPAQEEEAEEEAETEEEIVSTMMSEDDYWEITDVNELQRVSLINDQFVTNPQLSNKINMPLVGKLERSPSLERAGELERANYLMDRKEGPTQDEKINEKLRQMSLEKGGAQPKSEEQQPPAPESKEPTETSKEGLMPICVYNEEGEEIEYEIDGEDAKKDATSTEAQAEQPKFVSELDTPRHEDEDKEQMFNLEDEEMTEKAIIAKYVAEAYNDRNERRASLEKTFNDIATLVDKYNSAFYDLGMVAGRQMSTTSGEFIVSFIQRDIMAVIDEQIAVLPDPNLQKKKAKPEEKAMIREMLEAFLDENIQAIIPDVEVVQEEEEPLPEITIVYAVPGIGPPVDEEIMREFEEYALEACKVQSDVFMPRNIRHFLCPPLEKYVEINYDMGVGKPEVVGKKKKKKGEEKCVTGGGTIAE